MNDPQNEPRTCPYCDQPRQDTFENRFRFECGTAVLKENGKTVKQGRECKLLWTRSTKPTPTPEAVEAAMKWIEAGTQAVTGQQLTLLHEYFGEPSMGASWNAERILAAEVERLRGELETRHKEYSKALNKRVDVEAQLIDIGAGKRALPSREECMAWALKLGNS